MKSQEILNAGIWRYAVKLFDKERKISDKDFAVLLDVTRYAPSSFGMEPWNIVVIQDEDVRAKLAECSSGAKSQLASASHFVVFTVTTDLEGNSEHFRHMMKDVKGFDDEKYLSYVDRINMFQREKHDLTDVRKRVDWAGKQAYLALGNMLLAASLMGIDSCPIEGFIPEEAARVLVEANCIEKGKIRVPVMAAFGYRIADSKSPKSRRKIEEVVKYL